MKRFLKELIDTIIQLLLIPVFGFYLIYIALKTTDEVSNGIEGVKLTGKEENKMYLHVICLIIGFILSICTAMLIIEMIKI